MESDRADVNVGEAVDAELGMDQKPPMRQPKRRFIGRKEAAERAERTTGTNTTIDDDGALQGKNHGEKFENKS